MRMRLVLILVCLTATATGSLRAQSFLNRWQDSLGILDDDPYADPYENPYAEFDSFDRSWTLQGNLLFLDRSKPDEVLLIYRAADATNPIRASDLDLGGGSGFDVALTHRRERTEFLEFRYLSLGDFQSGKSAFFSDDVRINNGPSFTSPLVVRTDAFYSAKLHSLEVNTRTLQDDHSILITGLRYIELDERLLADFDANLSTTEFDLRTRNRLYGLQVGGESVWRTYGPLAIEGLAKIGMFGNAMGQTTETNATMAGALSRRLSLLGEFKLTLALSLTDSIDLTAGYQFLWIHGLALATEQVPFGVAGGLAPAGEAIYQGAFFGISLVHY